MAGSWWREDLIEKLSQGDVLRPVALALPIRPEIGLKKVTCKKGATHWAPETSDGHFLARGGTAHTIVLSHSCDLDKPKDGAAVLVAPVFKIDTLPPEHRGPVLEQRTISMLALPELPEVGDAYVDLRSPRPIPRELAGPQARLVSMSDTGLIRLQAQLMEFFLRLKPETIEKILRESATG
jgi:hypothetical protein